MKVYAVMKGTTMIQVMLPSHPFVDFKKIYILSAAFQRSQMYHLFESEGCRLRNRTRFFLDKYTRKGYGHALEVIENRRSELVIAPLLADNTLSSKYQLYSGIILPVSQMLAFTQKKDELGITTDAMRDIIEYLKNPIMSNGSLKPNQRQFVKAFKDFGARYDILNWQIEKSEYLAAKWFAAHGKPHRGLLFVNADEEKLISYNRKLLTTVSIGKAEGNNGYQKSNLAVFLAAVNPDPVIGRVFKAILPDYDPDEDYAINKAIQCLSRGNLRDHTSKERMLVIVPTNKTAEMIHEMLNDLPLVRHDTIDHLGGYATWSYKLSRAIETTSTVGTKAERNKTRQQHHKQDPLNRKLASLRSSRSQYQKQEDLESVQRIQQHIDILIKKRDERKKWANYE